MNRLPPCADCGGRGPHAGPGHPYRPDARLYRAVRLVLAGRAGWYVLDVTRSRADDLVLVGDRHATPIEAQTEIRRLEIELAG